MATSHKSTYVRFRISRAIICSPCWLERPRPQLHRRKLRRLRSNDLTMHGSAKAKFRADLLIEFNYRCAVTGLAIPALLRASHIKAWCLSTDSERLDPNNGLLLAAGVDAAFDRGFVSFDVTGALLVNSDLTPADRASLGLPATPKCLAPQFRTSTRMAFLEHHRNAFGH
jgi:hypothetical protein